MAIKKRLHFILLVLYLLLENTDAAVPGLFFWKPRVGIDLTVPSTEPSPSLSLPSRTNVEDGVVVLINGYEAGITLMAIIAGATVSDIYLHLNPMSAYFYTNSYRWALRHFSMMPAWLGGGRTYYDTIKVWRRRFYYLDTFMPKFMRYMFPYVKQAEWDKEEKEMHVFKKFAEPAFGKNYRYPNKRFNGFKSFETEESQERLDLSSIPSTDIHNG